MLNDAMLQQSASQLLDLLSAGHFPFLQEPVYKLWGHQRPLIRHSFLFTRLQKRVFNVHQPAERDGALINISNSLCISLRDHSPQNSMIPEEIFTFHLNKVKVHSASEFRQLKKSNRTFKKCNILRLSKAGADGSKPNAFTKTCCLAVSTQP